MSSIILLQDHCTPNHMSSTQSRREKRKAKKEAKKRLLEQKMAAAEAEKQRLASPKYARDQKREKLLGDIDQVQNAMNANITKALDNYGTVSDIEQQSTNLVTQASQFQRQTGRVDAKAFWDKMARTVYVAGIAFGILMLVLGLIWHAEGFCDPAGPEPDPPQQTSELPSSQAWQAAHTKHARRPNGTRAVDEYSPLDMLECPTFWFGAIFLIDLIVMTLFWFRKKVCCIWCDCWRLGRCECCLKWPSECCRKCGR